MISDHLYTSESDFNRCHQILPYKVGPHTERVNYQHVCICTTYGEKIYREGDEAQWLEPRQSCMRAGFDPRCSRVDFLENQHCFSLLKCYQAITLMAASSGYGWYQCITVIFAQGHALRAPHSKYIEPLWRQWCHNPLQITDMGMPVWDKTIILLWITDYCDNNPEYRFISPELQLGRNCLVFRATVLKANYRQPSQHQVYWPNGNLMLDQRQH